MSLTTGAQGGNGVTVAAFTQGTTWGTAVAVGAGDGVRIKSESLTGGPAALPRASLGLPYGDTPDAGSESHRGPWSGDLYYGGNCGKLLAAFFGTSGSPTQTPPSTGTSYLHVCTLQDALDKFLTLVLAKRASQKWWEFASAKAARLTIRGEGNGRVEWELEFIANALDRDSSTNSTTETDAVTVPTIQGATRFKHGTFRINAQGGDALDSDDKISVSRWSLEITRPLPEDFLADGTDYVAEPCEDGEIEVMMKFSLRSYDAETWKDAWAAGTEYKWDMKFVGTGFDGGTGADPYYLFECPRAVVARDPQASTSGRGRVQHEVEMKCLVASSAPTGMSGITQPVQMSVMDTDSSAYLS